MNNQKRVIVVTEPKNDLKNAMELKDNNKVQLKCIMHFLKHNFQSRNMNNKSKETYVGLFQKNNILVKIKKVTTGYQIH